jgi:hypothetical protein
MAQSFREQGGRTAPKSNNILKSPSSGLLSSYVGKEWQLHILVSDGCLFANERFFNYIPTRTSCISMHDVCFVLWNISPKVDMSLNSEPTSLNYNIIVFGWEIIIDNRMTFLYW